MRCTWEFCTRDATVKRVNARGEVWAHLCARHQVVLDDAIANADLDFPRLFYCWAKAQGGHHVAAHRLAGKFKLGK